MRITKLLFALQAFATLTLAEWVISTDTVTRGTINLSLGSITIKPGVFWSIINNAVSIFTGNLSVGKGSGFYITSTSNLIALNVALAGIINSITNDGIIQFNSAKSLTAPTVNLVGLSMTNNGQMYFGGDGSVGVPEFSLTAANWKNNGLISFYQKTMSTGVVLLGGGGAVLPITNDGDICFFNTVFQQTTSIKGDGCLHVIGSSLMNLSQTLISVAQSQTILFEPGSTGDILTSPLALSNTYTVRGFGDGMRIGNSLTIVRYSYSGSILTLTLDLVGLVNQKIDIGPGYDKSKFALVSKIYPNIGSPLRNALVYRGPVPSGAATDAKCGSCTSLVEEPTSASTTLESIPTATSESSTSDESSPTTDITITSDNTESSSSACHECTEYTTTWTTTGEDGKPTTGSGIVDVTTDSDGSLVTSTSNYPEPSNSECADCTEYTTTWTTTGEDGKPTTGSGIVDVTTDSDGSLVTSTSNYPQPSETGCAECTEYTTTWTTTGEDGKPTTGSGIVDVTTDSDGSLVTSTSNYPEPSNSECADCTEYTTTWTTTGEDGKPTTGSGIVDVTTDSDGSLVTSTSNYPQPSETGCAECTEYTTTWTTTGEDGESSTGTGIVHVTTDSDGALSTWTTLAPQETCADCTEYTTTWTTTGEDGKPTTGSGIVDVTTDSDGSLVTSTSNYPQPSETGCAECTEYTTTWTTTGEDGKPTTGSGIVDVTTDSDGSLVTSTSNYPQPSETGCAECTEYTTTWTTTGEDGKPTTGSGIVDVTTDSDGSLVTSTSNYPEPSNSECADCTEYTTTWTTTGEDGKPTTGSGIVDVTTDSDGSLVTSTSNYPQPSETGCAECTEYTTTWTTTGEDGESSTGTGIVHVTTDSDGALSTWTTLAPQETCADCTEYTTTWTTTGEDGKPTTGSGIVDVTTDSDGSLVTSTSNYPEPSNSECADCTEYTTTWTTTGEDGKPTTGSGIVDVTTDSDGSLVTSTSNYPQPSETGCAECTEYTTTWTTTGEDGKPTTGSGIVDVTTDSDGSLVTSTSNYPQPSETGCAECTEYTTTWTTTGEDGKPTTGSGIVDVTTDSDGSLVTSTSNYPEPSNSECADCTEYTTTWTTTGEDGKPTTGSGIVDVTTDSDGSLVTSTSNYPQPSETGCAECTEYTTTWTTTGEDGKPTTGSGIVDVTTDSDGSLVTSTSNYPQPSETGCAECTGYTTTWTTTGEDGESSTGTGIVHVTTDSDGALSTWTTLAPQETCADCTEYTTTWTTTGEDGKPTTGSGIVDVTTDSDGSLVTSTSNYPQPSETGCAECTEYTTTWTTTGEDGKPTTGSGIVDVTTDSDGSLVTSTSNYPQPSETGCAECTEYTTTWTTTGEDGKPTTGSGIVDVTTDSDGSLVTSTSNYPEPSNSECADCTEYTTTWTTTGEDGKPTTGSGIVDVTTDSDGSLVTSTSNYPQPSETGCAECTEYTTTWTTTGEDGKPTTGSGIVDVTTDSDGSLVTSTSNYPQPSETGCAECTEYTTTWTTTGEDGKPTTGSGIVDVTTDSDGSLVTSTSNYPQPSETGCAECTEYTTTWTTTGEDGKPTTGSGIVDVTTDSDGSLVTSTSNYPEPSNSECADCTEYTTTVSKSCEIKPTIITTVLDETVTVTQSCQYVVSTDEHGGTHTYTDFYGETVTGYSSNDAGVEYVSSAVVVEHSEMGTVVTYTLPLGSATRTSTAFSEDSGPGGPSEDSPTIAGIEILTTNSVGEVVTVTLSAPSMQTSVFTERLDGWQSQASMNLGVSSVPDVNTLSAGAAPTNAIGKRITLAFVGVISVLLL
ncbi:cell wall protein Rbr3p [Diutina catenulata]